MEIRSVYLPPGTTAHKQGHLSGENAAGGQAVFAGSLGTQVVKVFNQGGLIMRRSNVLFLCTGNSARSQMAEAFLRKYAGDRFDVHSAGLDPQGINPYARQVMKEIGVDLEGHTSKSIKEYLGKVPIAQAITVCEQAEKNCPRTFLLSVGEHLHWHFEDPASFQGTNEEKLAKFREVRDQIHQQIKNWLELKRPRVS